MNQQQIEEAAAVEFPQAYFREVYFDKDENGWFLNAKFNLAEGETQVFFSVHDTSGGIYFADRI